MEIKHFGREGCANVHIPNVRDDRIRTYGGKWETASKAETLKDVEESMDELDRIDIEKLIVEEFQGDA